MVLDCISIQVSDGCLKKDCCSMILLTEKNTLSLCMTLKIVIIATYVQKIRILMELILADNKIAGLIAIAIRGKKLKNDVIKKGRFRPFFCCKKNIPS